MRLSRLTLFKVLIFSALAIGAAVISHRHNLNPVKEGAKQRPNILLITIDALRPDHLGCYGYHRDTSPHIDKLAREGVIFTQAISQGPETVLSLPSLMTSLYPSQHGIHKLGRAYRISAPTLAEVLDKNGYYSVGFVAHSLDDSGIRRGFDLIDFDHRYNAGTVTGKTIDWLSKNRGKRFFLWLHYIDTHAAYLPPAPYDTLFVPVGLKDKGGKFLKKKYFWILDYGIYHSESSPGNKDEKISGDKVFLKPNLEVRKTDARHRNFPAHVSVVTKQTFEGNLTEEDRQYYISQYDGELRFVDDQIGVLLEGLRDLGLDEETLIILCSDHGENLADYGGYFFHAGSLHDILLRVPLIINYRELSANKTIESQVQLIDIMPTILDLLKIRADVRMEGTSLLPLIRGKKVKLKDYAFSEIYGVNNARSVRTEDWKLIYYLDNDRYELFNLRTDPWERHNLIYSQREEFGILKSELKKWMRKTVPVRPALSAPVDEGVREKLRSLGYAQ